MTACIISAEGKSLDLNRNSAKPENSTRTIQISDQLGENWQTELIANRYFETKNCPRSTSLWVVREFVCKNTTAFFKYEFSCRKKLHFQLCSLHKITKREGAPHFVNILNFYHGTKEHTPFISTSTGTLIHSMSTLCYFSHIRIIQF